MRDLCVDCGLSLNEDESKTFCINCTTEEIMRSARAASDIGEGGAFAAMTSIVYSLLKTNVYLVNKFKVSCGD